MKNQWKSITNQCKYTDFLSISKFSQILLDFCNFFVQKKNIYIGEGSEKKIIKGTKNI